MFRSELRRLGRGSADQLNGIRVTTRRALRVLPIQLLNAWPTGIRTMHAFETA